MIFVFYRWCVHAHWIDTIDWETDSVLGRMLKKTEKKVTGRRCRHWLFLYDFFLRQIKKNASRSNTDKIHTKTSANRPKTNWILHMHKTRAIHKHIDIKSWLMCERYDLCMRCSFSRWSRRVLREQHQAKRRRRRKAHNRKATRRTVRQ